MRRQYVVAELFPSISDTEGNEILLERRGLRPGGVDSGLRPYVQKNITG